MNDDKTLEGAIDDEMSFDPIWEAEKTVKNLTGNQKHSYKDGLDTPEGQLNMALSLRNIHENAARKQELAQINRDTHMNSTLEDYLAVVRDLGFQEVLKLEVPRYEKDPQDNEGPDYFYVFATEDGLVLRFDTYWGSKKVNGGNLLFNWATTSNAQLPGGYGASGGWSGFDRENWKIFPQGHFKYSFDYETKEEVDEFRDYCRDGGWIVWSGYFDCRDFLRRRVEGLRNSKDGELLSPWAKRPFLWLLHYNDTHCPTCDQDGRRCRCVPTFSYDYNQINQERIKQAAPLLRKILGTAEED